MDPDFPRLGLSLKNRVDHFDWVSQWEPTLISDVKTLLSLHPPYWLALVILLYVYPTNVKDKFSAIVEVSFPWPLCLNTVYIPFGAQILIFRQ